MQKILIIQTAFIGDVILATGMLETLHAAIPNAEISILLRKGNESLFAEHPFVKEVLVWDKKKDKYFGLLKMIKTIRSNRFDVVFNVQRFFSSGLITVFSGAKTTIGFDKNPLSSFFSKKIEHQVQIIDALHETSRNQALIDAWIKTEIKKPRLYTKSSLLNDRDYVTISPASVWETKKTPVSKWVELINRNKEVTFYLLGGPSDTVLCEEIAKATGLNLSQVLAGKFSLLESAAIMKNASMNFVNDSGPLHLCTAVDAPVTAVFCSTIPEFGFGPLSGDSKIIESIPRPSCKPCGLHGKRECPLGHFSCGNNISVEQLEQRLP